MRRKEPLHSDQRSGPSERSPIGVNLEAGRDNFRDNRGDSRRGVSRDLVSTQLSPRGEVAEWLKAMVC